MPVRKLAPQTESLVGFFKFSFTMLEKSLECSVIYIQAKFVAHVGAFKLKTNLQGPVVQKPISTNPRLNI